MLVFAVDADLVIEDGVEAHIAEVGDLLYLAQIVAVAFAHAEHRAAGAEHLLPEVRKGFGRRAGVDRDRFQGEAAWASSVAKGRGEQA